MNIHMYSRKKVRKENHDRHLFISIIEHTLEIACGIFLLFCLKYYVSLGNYGVSVQWYNTSEKNQSQKNFLFLLCSSRNSKAIYRNSSIINFLFSQV